MPTEPSITAEVVALVRAREQDVPSSRRIVDDPFAGSFLEAARARLVRLGGETGLAARGLGAILKLPGVSVAPIVLARHRIMDDVLLAETAAGARQCVILGAGYDARAHRFAPPRGPARFFEVDHPTLSSRKRELVRAALGAPSPHVTYVAVDFLSERLSERLVAEGFDPGARTVFLWEGVTYYLTNDAVRATLEEIRRLGAPASVVVFDLWVRPAARLGGALVGGVRAATLATARLLGEPFLFEPVAGGGAALLATAGFEVVRDAGASAMNALLRASGRPFLYVPPYVSVAVGRIPSSPPGDAPDYPGKAPMSSTAGAVCG